MRTKSKSTKPKATSKPRKRPIKPQRSDMKTLDAFFGRMFS